MELYTAIKFTIPLVFFILLSIIDLKTYNRREGAIPSAITTTFIILAFILNPNPVSAIMGLLLGMLFVDLDVFGGVPDWKVIVAGSIVLGSIWHIFIFATAVLVIGLIYKLLLKWRTRGAIKEIPFIPAIALAYLLTLGVVL